MPAERVTGGGQGPDYAKSMEFAELIKTEYCKRYRVDSIDKLTPKQKADMMCEMGAPQHIVRPS